VALVIVMSQQTKRARGDGDAADEPTEGGAVVNGLAVKYSFVYTTFFNPAAVMYLHTNKKVAFQQAADLAPCSSHGSWTLSRDQLTLRVHFHFRGNWKQIREHVYKRLPHSSSFELEVNDSEYKAFLIQRSTECDAADEPTEGGAVVASASAAPATSSQQGILFVNGVAVKHSFLYTTMLFPAAVMYLLADEKVAFQQADDQAPCSSHGCWSRDQLKLRVWFHFNDNSEEILEHVYLRLPHSSSFELRVNKWVDRAFLIPRTTE
jgi:hypothetical protein